MSVDDDPLTDALWQTVLADPEREQAHAALLDHGEREGKLGELARRYRQWQQQLAEDDTAGRAAIARRLGAITSRALAGLERQRRPERPERKVNPMVLLAAAAVLAMAVYGLVAAFL